MSSRTPTTSQYRHDNLVMLFCSMVGFSSLYVTQSLGPALQQWQNVSVHESGALLMATTLGLAISSPLAGMLTQKLGLRRSLLLGLTALGLSHVAFAYATGFSNLVTLRVFQGVSMPLVLSALLTSIERQPDEGSSLGIAAAYVMGTLCGGTLGRLLPALVIDRLGWRDAFLTMAVLHVGALIVAVLTFKPRMAPRAGFSPARKVTEAAVPSLVWVCASGFGLLFSQVAVFTYVAFRLAAPPFGWSTAALGCLYLVFLPALGLVRASRTAVASWGHGRAFGAAIIVSWCSLILTFSDKNVAVIPGLVGFSAAIFFAQAILAHALSSCACQSRAQASGRYLFFYYLGGSLGAIFPALVWQRSGWTGCLALVGCMQGALIVAVKTRDRKRYFEKSAISANELLSTGRKT